MCIDCSLLLLPEAKYDVYIYAVVWANNVVHINENNDLDVHNYIVMPLWNSLYPKCKVYKTAWLGRSRLMQTGSYESSFTRQ